MSAEPGTLSQRSVRLEEGVVSPDETPLMIGSRLMPSRYFLAPLAGYTHLAFRTVVRELGGLGLATTDLVQAAMLLSGRPKSLDSDRNLTGGSTTVGTDLQWAA